MSVTSSTGIIQYIVFNDKMELGKVTNKGICKVVC